jgi:LruC domain-containing protein
MYFFASTNAPGNVTGSFTYNINQPQVLITIYLNDGRSFSFQVDLTNVSEIERELLIQADGSVTPVAISDRDKDGVPDNLDAYPDDPTRSAVIRIPTDSYYNVAYEDLYPKQGDADFNDYVVKVYYEEDLNAAGDVVRIRGYYQHVAKGAGYNHTLRLKLPATGNYTLQRFGYSGEVELNTTGNLTPFDYIELLPNSSSTIPQSNTDSKQTFHPGKKAQLEIILSAPTKRASLGSAPYDLYIYVITTNKEIHFLGKYFDQNGKDLYLDPTGFPWALLIPGDNWKWPLERVNIKNAYANFIPWYESAGASFKDWFNSTDLTKVFNF